MTTKERGETEFPYTKVLVRIRLNPRWAERLQEAGVDLILRSLEDERRLIERKKTEAESVGREPFRGERKDATGTLQPDSGKSVFGWDQRGRENVSLAFLERDLEKVGFVLAGANLMQKEGDRMYFLYLTFESSGRETPLAPSREVMAMIRQLLGRFYGNVHAFKNPNGSCTVNPAHAVVEGELPAGTPLRQLRINATGHFRCVPG